MNHAPSTQLCFEKFQALKHLSMAVDEVRRHECKLVSSEKKRRFIEGQRYLLLSTRAGLTLEGRLSLKLLLNADCRVRKAYLLKESFDPLWSCNNPTWA
jgi:transposase